MLVTTLIKMHLWKKTFNFSLKSYESLSWSTAIGLRPSLCVVRSASCVQNITCLTSWKRKAWPITTIFCLKRFQNKINLNYEIKGWTIPRVKIKRHFYFNTCMNKTKCIIYMFTRPIPKIHDQCVRCSKVKGGQIWPYCENILNLWKSATLLPNTIWLGCLWSHRLKLWY